MLWNLRKYSIPFESIIWLHFVAPVNEKCSQLYVNSDRVLQKKEKINKAQVSNLPIAYSWDADRYHKNHVNCTTTLLETFR